MSGSPLLLVHATEASRLDDEGFAALAELRYQRLERKARRLREQGIEVQTLVEAGVPDEVLLAAASKSSARWLVVGAVGQRRRTAQLGSHADRIARETKLPILVVRDAQPFERWTRGEHTLKIVLGVTPDASAVAVRTTAELARLGPCDVTAVYYYWPPTEWARLGLTGIRDIQKEDPDVRRALERDLEPTLAGLRGAARFELLTEPNLGSIGERLTRLAGERGADLLAVGSRPHGVLQRLWEGSVSRSVIAQAHVSVACIPEPLERARRTRDRRHHALLVATDFSKAGNEAVRLAYDTVEEQGIVHLAHVSGRAVGDALAPHDIFEGGPDRDSVSALLSALVPKDAAERGVSTQIHTLSSDNAAGAICQAAERLDADAIFLGTPAHGGLAGVLLGSVASAVVARTKRRVVLVRPPEV